MATEGQADAATSNVTPAGSISPPADQATPGQILRATRAQSGIDREVAARAANLGVSIVMAMEADDFATLGLPVYARGYYRRYAKVIGCDSDAVLSAYEHTTDNPSPVPQIAQRPSIPYGGKSAVQKSLPAAALILVALVVGYMFFSASDRSDDAGTAVGNGGVNTPVTESSPNLAAQAPTLAPLPDTRRPVEVDMQAALEQAGKTQTTNPAASQAEKASVGDASGLKLSTQMIPPNRLEIITGPQAAWIEVIDALGEKLAYRVVNPGETVVIEGDPPYSVNLGMAHTLTIRYGGRVLDLQAVTDSASRARATIAANGEIVPR